ncbi:MAG TPA: lysylphosphatidylglycerol synthase domain-containing protein [Herminiimonas sp.]|nr:lysylphosphatidylglycerol synthase domain-containing protein [Herminiimonas sp.]
MSTRPADYQTAETLAQTGCRLTQRRWWPWLTTAAKIAFFVLVAWLLITQARSIEWQQVFDTMQARPLQGLLLAAIFTMASYALYGCFDLLGRYLTGHTLRPWQVISISLICYAFNFNLGATIGGAGFRFRLYSRLGLNLETVTRVLVTSTLTNWLGYFLLGGLVFSLRPLTLPEDWNIGSSGLRIMGVAMLAVALAYVLLCAFAGGRSRSIRGYELTVPSLRFAMLQLAMSCVTWLMIASVLFVLLQQKIPFSDVLCVLLIACIAGIMTHVPGGLGVIEAVFVTLLSQQMAKNELLASMLMYRMIFYIIPLALAALGYLAMEARIRKKA